MSQELTLGEFLSALQDYFRFFVEKWYWILLGALLTAGILGYVAFSKPAVYSAPLTFLLTEEKGGQISGAGALLGSLGLGNGKENANVPLQLLELGRSRHVLSQVLFDTAVIDGERRMIADHIILEHSFYEKWAGIEELDDFLFNGNIPSAKDRIANMAFKSIYNYVIQDAIGLQKLFFDEDTGVFTIQSNSTNAELAMHLTEKSYKELSDYFTESVVANQRNTLRLLNQREDSIVRALTLAEGKLARYQDRSGGVTLRQSTTRIKELSREVLILSTIYTEVIKNRETTAFLLAKKRPVFTLIDPPLQPLYAPRDSIVKAILIGGALGTLLVVIGLFFAKLFRTALNENRLKNG